MDAPTAGARAKTSRDKVQVAALVPAWIKIRLKVEAARDCRSNVSSVIEGILVDHFSRHSMQTPESAQS